MLRFDSDALLGSSLAPSLSDLKSAPCWYLTGPRKACHDLTDRSPRRTMSHETIIVETRGRVGLIRLNRPQALNALNATIKNELLAAAEAFDADAAIGCILIAGSDKAFAAGADIKEMVDQSYIDIFNAD